MIIDTYNTWRSNPRTKYSPTCDICSRPKIRRLPFVVGHQRQVFLKKKSQEPTTFFFLSALDWELKFAPEAGFENIRITQTFWARPDDLVAGSDFDLVHYYPRIGLCIAFVILFFDEVFLYYVHFSDKYSNTNKYKVEQIFWYLQTFLLLDVRLQGSRTVQAQDIYKLFTRVASLFHLKILQFQDVHLISYGKSSALVLLPRSDQK